jgi:hypothetical protein
VASGLVALLVLLSARRTCSVIKTMMWRWSCFIDVSIRRPMGLVAIQRAAFSRNDNFGAAG